MVIFQKPQALNEKTILHNLFFVQETLTQSVHGGPDQRTKKVLFFEDKGSRFMTGFSTSATEYYRAWFVPEAESTLEASSSGSMHSLVLRRTVIGCTREPRAITARSCPGK